VRPEPYRDLAGHPGIRVRIERLDGSWAKARDAKRGEVWWTREQLMFCVASNGPHVDQIVEASTQLRAALDALSPTLAKDDTAVLSDPEVTMFHSVYVRVSVWCTAGTAKRLGVM